MSGSGEVGPTANEAGKAEAVGIATYDVSAGDQVSVAGPGNIVYACLDEAYDPGSLVYASSNGILSNSSNGTKIAGIVLTTPTSETTNYVGEVLLV